MEVGFSDLKECEKFVILKLSFISKFLNTFLNSFKFLRLFLKKIDIDIIVISFFFFDLMQFRMFLNPVVQVLHQLFLIRFEKQI